MMPFSRLFRRAPAPVPATVDERIAMLDTGSSDLILGIALGTHEEALRVAAIRKLPDGEALRRLAGLSTPAERARGAIPDVLERAAQARVAELVESGSVDFTALCASSGHSAALLAVAAQSADPGRLGQVLALIQDPAHIGRLVLEGRSSRIRQLAAEGVEDPAQLRQLLKQVRDKDKSVYKILKQKSDALSAKERKEAQLAAEITAVCASLELHGHRAYDAHYVSILEQLKVRWSSLAGPPAADIKLRAVEAVDRCHEVIAAHIRMAAQRAAQQEAEGAAAQAAEDVREREHQAAREAASAQAEAEAQIQREATAIREAEEAARAKQLEAEENVFRQIGGLIRQAKGSLEVGNTQRAAGLRRAIEEKLPNAPALPVHLARSLQQLDDKLVELKQWKDYAVAPKRIELIEEMETLIGSTDEPRVLADRIKALQEEWRTTAKGIASDAPEEWERFHRASQTAYQPCKEFYEAQAKLRNQNLEHRMKVLERLAAFETSQNVEHPDWRLIASVLREAPLEWRRYHPMDREPGRAIQQDFDAAMGRLQSRLGAWHESNVADKQALIKRARQLLVQEDSREAMDAVKRLQMTWKETGQGPRDQDQSLWNEFREQCDAVYQRRQQAYADYAAGLEASKAKALVLCEEAERAAEFTGPALLEVAGKVPEWRAAFDALDEMPRLEAKDLKVRFERALDLCLSRIAEQHARDAKMSFTNLLEAGRHVRIYEWALMENADSTDRETFKQAARSFIESVPRWPRGGLQTVKDALAKAESTPGAGADAREKALRILCIRSEIECEFPSPADDDALRREYQVQRLTQQMGQGINSSDGDWDARGLEWSRIGAVSPLLHDALQERFLRCWSMRPIDAARPPFRHEDAAADRKGSPNRAGQGRGNGRDRFKASPRR
jgi:hypothetical protein